MSLKVPAHRFKRAYRPAWIPAAVYLGPYWEFKVKRPPHLGRFWRCRALPKFRTPMDLDTVRGFHEWFKRMKFKRRQRRSRGGLTV